jgi:carbamoyltransferase
VHAIAYCLEEAGLKPEQLDYVAFYDKPFLKFERLLETYLAFAPRGFSSFRIALPVWLKEKLFQRELIIRELKSIEAGPNYFAKLLFTEHHLSHSASAFFPSPFREAAVLTMDGVGEWATTSLGYGADNNLQILKEIHFPHSLGLLYSAFTYYTGFKVNSGEYKLMGLAPYGEPKYASMILDKIIHINDDGSIWLDQSYFDYCVGLRMTSTKFAELFGRPARQPDKDLLTQFHMDVAASIQHVTEIAVSKLARELKRVTQSRNLCMAGGVALNCVANGKLVKEGVFDEIWIQPAAGDAGGALGAALAACHMLAGGARTATPGRDGMNGAYLGPGFAEADIRTRLTAAGAKFSSLGDGDLLDTTARALADGKAVGWMQGRMEFGPRALGNRSILGDPRSPTMQKVLNLKVKYRESFRPFAPSVLAEDTQQWFDLGCDSPYMLLVAPVGQQHWRTMTADENALFGIDKLNVPRSSIPAVTHIDYSARVQTVHADTNPRYHALISAFKRLTGCGVVVNTSFNVRGEPIVYTPEDAFRCFMGSDIEVLVVGNCHLVKEAQDPALRIDYKDQFELD